MGLQQVHYQNSVIHKTIKSDLIDPISNEMFPLSNDVLQIQVAAMASIELALLSYTESRLRRTRLCTKQ